MKIAFIGLGIMGKPMAKNLLKAGYQLRVYDRRQETLDEMAAAGATICGSSVETVEGVEFVNHVGRNLFAAGLKFTLYI